MKKGIAAIFLFLYAYNLLGYYAVFKTLQHEVRVKIEARIKESLPETELVLITVSKGEEARLHWLDGHEFLYRGNIYDIVHQYSTADTHYYVCINDRQEERLFKNLDLHITAQCDIEEVPEKVANPFKGIIKEYIPQNCALGSITFQGTRVGITQRFNLISQTADVATPPPRLL